MVSIQEYMNLGIEVGTHDMVLLLPGIVEYLVQVNNFPDHFLSIMVVCIVIKIYDKEVRVLWFCMP